MKHFNIISFFGFISFLILSEGAIAQFKIDAQLRNRFEFRDGYQKILPNTANPAFLISQRSRLSFSFEADKIKLKFTPQDVRVWGDEQLASTTGVFGDVASLDLFEGYAEIKANSHLWLSIGRQQLVYDNQRLLATRNWNQNGISYDALVAKFSINEWILHAGGSWNTRIELNSENPYDSNRIKTLNFFWLNRQLNENLIVSFMHIASGVTKTDTTNTIHFRQTTGFYSGFKKKNLSFWGDVWYQYGKNQPGKNISAFLSGADISYKLGKFSPGIGFAYLSGNTKTGDALKTDHLFDILYGARHRYFGYMDYFRNIPSHTNQGGLVDFYFYLEIKISEPFSLQNTGHYFRLAQTNPTTSSGKKLGYENDLVFKYKFCDWGILEGGYLLFLPTESLRFIQNVSHENFAQFAYLQLTLTPTLFNQRDH